MTLTEPGLEGRCVVHDPDEKGRLELWPEPGLKVCGRVGSKDGSLRIRPETEFDAMIERLGVADGRPLTAEEFEEEFGHLEGDVEA